MPARAPDVPWALHLADRSGRVWLIAFDFDDTPGRGQAGQARRDALKLSRWLAARDVPHAVCRSGGREGRHVWIRLTRPVEAALVRRLAYAAKTVFPTLDIAPLCNTGTGAVRPPGAPHRSGSVSTVLRTAGRPAGQVLAWADHGTVPGIVEDLLAWCGHPGPCPAPSSDAATISTTPPVGAGRQIDHQHGRIPGPRRALPPHVAALAQATVEDRQDASAIAWSVLLSAAHAHWDHAEVHQAAATLPGLTHLVTYRTPTGRARRADPGPHIDRQWSRALAAAAAPRPQPAATGPGTAATTDHARRVLAAAWSTGLCTASRTGCVYRLVLYAIAETMRTTGRCEVALSVRDWALTAGLSRTTTHLAIQALMAAGWLVRTAASDGPLAASYTLVIPAGTGLRTHSFPPPAARPGPARVLAHMRQDIWAIRGLGPAAGLVHHVLTAAETPTLEKVAQQAGLDVGLTRLLVEKLRGYGLVAADRLAATGPSQCEAAARAAGVAGILAARRRRYTAESAAWAWWCAEQAWRVRRLDQLRAGPDPTGGLGFFPTRQGRADWGAARAALLHPAGRAA